MKRILLTCVSLALVFLSTAAIAQNRTVSGKVTSAEDGLPLPNVTVLIKGTTEGTPTNVDGEFTLSVPNSGATLVFRFLGFVTQEVNVTERSVYNITMQTDATSLGDVIVTGVATGTPEKKLAFSIAKIDEDLIQQVPQTNAGGAIRGKVAGVKVRQGGAPLSNPTFQIRGAAQLRTSNNPLIVVDGILIEGALADINMQDVENIEVLKGASGASLYGSRAANGVIAITTRRGNKLDVGTTNVLFRNEAGFETLYNSRAPQKTNSHHFLSNPDGSIQTTGSDGFDLGVADPDQLQDNPLPRNVDHLKQGFEGNTFWTSYLQITSNYATGNIAASFENTLSGGVVALNDGANRQNLRVNIDQNITDRLKVSVSALYARRFRDLSYTGGLGTRGALRNLFMMDPSADLNEVNVDGTPYRWNVNKFGNSEGNPLYTLNNLTDEFLSNRFLGNARVSYELAKGLTFEYSASLDRTQTESFSFLPKGHLDVSAGQNTPFGQRSDSFGTQTALISTSTVSYATSFGDWNLRSRAFYQYENNEFKNWGLSAREQQANGIISYNNFAFTNPLSSSEGRITANNYAVAIGGDYQDKYIADVVVRYEGVSLFGADERFQTFFRGSFNYRISEDVQIPGFQELSVRGSYGTSGNRPNFADQFEAFGVNAGNISATGTLGNPGLRNAKTTEFELSLRADFLDRFTMLASYSSQENADQILVVPASGAATGGFSSQIANAGTVESNSIEVTLDYEAIRSEKMGLTFGLVFDRYQGEITEFDRRDQVVGLNIWRQGAKIGDIYGEDFAVSLDQLTVDNNGFVLNDPFASDRTIDEYSVNSDGFVVHTGSIGTAQESVLILRDENGVQQNDILLGNATPDFNLGMNTNFRLGGLNIYMLWTYQSGGLVYNQSRQWMHRDLVDARFDQGGKADGEKKTTAYYLSIYNVNRSNSWFLEDATNLRLAELAVNYNFGKSLLDRMGMGNVFKAAKLSFIGRNLLVVSDYTGFDPEVGNLQRPVDNFSFPLVRTFTGSLSLTF